MAWTTLLSAYVAVALATMVVVFVVSTRVGDERRPTRSAWL